MGGEKEAAEAEELLLAALYMFKVCVRLSSVADSQSCVCCAVGLCWPATPRCLCCRLSSLPCNSAAATPPLTRNTQPSTRQVPDVDFLLHLGDGCPPGLPLVQANINRSNEAAGFTLPMSMWWQALGPVQFAVLAECLQVRC
jgi:hypothetical protein